MLFISKLVSDALQTKSSVDPGFLERRVNAYYRERVQETWSGGHIMKGLEAKSGDIQLMSNDYLQLSNHPHIVQRQVEALQEEGHGVLRSDVFRSEASPMRRFEQDLAAHMGVEDTVVCQSGWNANVGLIQSIANAETPVYLDMYTHTSLWEGAKSAGAPPKPFRHNDAASLEKLIAKHGPGVVVVDSVYSTSGTVSPLKDIAEVSAAGGCVFVVDESHSLGLFGPGGAGLVEELGLGPLVHFRTASLSKAFAARGGIIAGTARNMEYFRYESLPAIFSSGMLPYEAAGFSATLELIHRAGERRTRLQDNAAYLRHGLSALGYNMDASQSQIIGLVAGTEQQTMVLRDALESRGVFGAVFCAPATAKNRALVRFSVHSELTRAQMDRVIGVCADIRSEVGMLDWASTKRRDLRAAV